MEIPTADEDFYSFSTKTTVNRKPHHELKMVSNRLSKVTKQITKKKGKNPNLHEGSRDTRRLQAAAARDDKLNRLTSLREKQNRHYCAILSFKVSSASANWD